jgi:hypothetical protein
MFEWQKRFCSIFYGPTVLCNYHVPNTEHIIHVWFPVYGIIVDDDTYWQTHSKKSLLEREKDIMGNLAHRVWIHLHINTEPENGSLNIDHLCGVIVQLICSVHDERLHDATYRKKHYKRKMLEAKCPDHNQSIDEHKSEITDSE